MIEDRLEYPLKVGLPVLYISLVILKLCFASVAMVQAIFIVNGLGLFGIIGGLHEIYKDKKDIGGIIMGSLGVLGGLFLLVILYITPNN